MNKERDITIFVSSHILGELEKIATRYGVISNGKMVDEFQADELAGRCGKNLLVHTDDRNSAWEIIMRMFGDAVCEHTPENAIRVKDHVADAGRIVKALVDADVTVNAVIPEGDKLEDYFLRLMGGHQYA